MKKFHTHEVASGDMRMAEVLVMVVDQSGNINRLVFYDLGAEQVVLISQMVLVLLCIVLISLMVHAVCFHLYIGMTSLFITRQ